MKTLRIFSLLALVILFSNCKSTSPTETTVSGNAVIQVAHILDTVSEKFYDFAQANLTSTPQQVLVMTADWVKTLPNVASAFWYDSTYLNITMTSGLQSMFAISIIGSDSLSLTRGGADQTVGGELVPTAKANHTITNKSVLIYSPFVEEEPSLFHKGEMLPLITKIRNSGKGVSVTVLENENASIQAIESFGNYGVVFIDTHGLPDGFFTGQVISGLSTQYDTTVAAIMENLNRTIPDGYNNILKGYFRFGYSRNIGNLIGWQKFLAKRSDGEYTYRLLANASYINSLPAMPNTRGRL